MTVPNPASDKAFDEALETRLPDEAATAALAATIAGALEPGTSIHLSGDLGAGKTAFARALLAALGHRGRVKSPTFTLLEPYNFPRFDLYHFDFYRFSSSDEWREAGFDEYFTGAAVTLVEWPEMGGPGLPAPDLRIRLEFDPDAEGVRHARLEARGPRGLACLRAARAAGFSGSA